MANFSQQQFTQRLAEIARSQAFDKFLKQVRENRKAHQELVETEKAVKDQNIKQQQEQINLTYQQALTEKAVQNTNSAPLVDLNSLVQKVQGSVKSGDLFPLTEEQQQGIKTYVNEVSSFIYELIEQAIQDGEINHKNDETHKQAIREALGDDNIDSQCELLIEAIESGLEKITNKAELSNESADSVVNQGARVAVEEVDEDQESVVASSQVEREAQNESDQLAASVVFAATSGLQDVIAARYEKAISLKSVPTEEVNYISTKIKSSDFSQLPANNSLIGVILAMSKQQQREGEKVFSEQMDQLQQKQHLGAQRLADLLGRAGVFAPKPQIGGQAELTQEELRKLQREQQKEPAAWRTTPSPYRY